jgi:hypothetical protein
LGERPRIAGTVYGTIIVLSILAASGKAYQHQLWRLNALIAISVTVLWLAHVYSHGLAESLAKGHRLTVREAGYIARRESSIVAAAILPVVALALGALDVIEPRTAFWLAFGIGVVTLTAQGIRYARLEHLSASAMIFAAGINLTVGLALVAVEAWIAH